MWAMVIKEFRELRRDRRSMAMLIALPILFLVVFGYAANFTVTSVSTDVVGPEAVQVSSRLAAPFEVGAVDPAGTRADAEQTLKDNDADAVVVTRTAAPPTALVDGSELFAAQAAVAGFVRLKPPLRTEVLFNPELKTSWVMVPALAGLILAFIGTIITSLGVVRERQAGTLEQLAVMPFRPNDVIAGKIAPYFVVGAVDMLAVTVLGVFVFGVPFNGSVLTFAIGATLFLLVVLGLGVLISTLSQNQGQAIQLAILVLLPQILLSGMIFPLAAMPWAIRWIGYVLPLTYFIDVARGLMVRGASLASLWPSFAILAVMAVFVFGAAVLRFRHDVAPEVKKRSMQEATA
jgi:ABC-2 type transport system permease protein